MTATTNDQKAPTPLKHILFASGLVLFAIFGQVIFFKYGSPVDMQAAASKLKIKATVFPDPKPIPHFSLLDQNGKAFTRDNLNGKWSLIAFGYTNCPDVCPQLLRTFNRIDGLMTGAAFEYPPQFLFVGIDPKRDTVDQMGGFLSHFNQKIIGLTGDSQQIKVLTKDLGIMSKRNDIDKLYPNMRSIKQPSEDSYLIDHTSAILIVNPNGDVHALTSPPHSGDVIARDYRNIVSLAAATLR